jgi:alkanesulfonate monooxygenase SsuD/methylene tetrahydromethanopterin reductase-like flavin-dependent oxidoreductase (luciferase family)
MVWRRERPVEHKGEYYQIPYAGPDATGLGKPLKSILHGRADIPIYLAAIGPKNVALAAEIADGLLPG